MGRKKPTGNLLSISVLFKTLPERLGCKNAKLIMIMLLFDSTVSLTIDTETKRIKASITVLNTKSEHTPCEISENYITWKRICIIVIYKTKKK